MIGTDAISSLGVVGTKAAGTWQHTMGSGLEGLGAVVATQIRSAGTTNLPIVSAIFKTASGTTALANFRRDTFPTGGTDGGQLQTELWAATSPVLGVGSFVITTVGTVNHLTAFGLSVVGVDRSVMVEGSAGVNKAAIAGTALGTLAPLSVNAWVINSFYSKIAPPITPGGSQTAIGTAGPNGNGDSSGASYQGPVAIPAATVLQWTYAGTDDYCMSLVALRPAALYTSFRSLLGVGM